MTHDPSGGARIGPNAVTQTFAAVETRLGADAALELARAAGSTDWLTVPPQGMVPEDAAARLHRTLREVFPEDAEALARDAGTRTGDYILAHRIPRPVRWLLKTLPSPIAARMLARAIARHAWTFAGSGRFAITSTRPLEFTITANPLIAGETADTPLCHWHAAVFSRLFSRLAMRRAIAREITCAAAGSDACRFQILSDETPAAADLGGFIDPSEDARRRKGGGGGGRR